MSTHAFLNSETSGDSETVFLRCGDVSDIQCTPDRLLVVSLAG